MRDQGALDDAGLQSIDGEIMSALERALAAPAPQRVDEWRHGVRESLNALHDVWTRHIVETEAPGAFLDDLVTEAPRLSKPAAHLRKEHSDIRATIVSGQLRLAEPPSEDNGYDAWAEEVAALRDSYRFPDAAAVTVP